MKDNVTLFFVIINCDRSPTCGGSSQNFFLARIAVMLFVWLALSHTNFHHPCQHGRLSPTNNYNPYSACTVLHVHVHVTRYICDAATGGGVGDVDAHIHGKGQKKLAIEFGRTSTFKRKRWWAGGSGRRKAAKSWVVRQVSGRKKRFQRLLHE